MPVYEYRCRECGEEASIVASMHAERPVPTCVGCQRVMGPVYTVSVPAIMPEHFNWSVGKHISSHQQHVEELKRLSARKTEATGIYHNYMPVDYREKGFAPDPGGHGEDEAKRIAWLQKKMERGETVRRSERDQVEGIAKRVVDPNAPKVEWTTPDK